jgi:hypothetical protein
MENNPQIEISRRVYARLIHLYPEAHRAEFGQDMLQVFTDQCRSVIRSGKWSGLPALWLRTLIDLVINVLKEHIASPQALSGLLEATPGQPLPWKGVVLVLIPGLIFFIAQVAQLTGRDWFFLMVYRAAYFLIIPVLIVWVWKRKFPIWGLIPLGLLFNSFYSVIYRLQNLGLGESNPFLLNLAIFLKSYQFLSVKIVILTTFLLGILTLSWFTFRQVAVTRRAWILFGVFIGLIVVHIVTINNTYVLMDGMNWFSIFFTGRANILREEILNMSSYDIYNYSTYLALILLGALIARRHGRLAVLLPLGYLLPALIYGRVSNDWPNPAEPQFTFMLSVSVAALAYRFLVALAGPVWIVRSASGKMQKRASIISLAALIGIQIGFNIELVLINHWSNLMTIYFLFSEQLIMGAGLALALTLYRTLPAAQTGQEEKKSSVPDPV